MNSSKIQAARELALGAFQRSSDFRKGMIAAQELLEAQLGEDPNDVCALTGLGAVLSDMGQHEKAILVLRKAVSNGSIDRNTFFNLGVAILNSGHHSEAMNVFDQAKTLTGHPDTWEAYFDPQAH